VNRVLARHLPDGRRAEVLQESPEGNDRDWRLDFIPAEIRKAVSATNTGEFGAENRLITFMKERLKKDPPAEFVAPDHPLFDTVLDKVLEAGRPTLTRGTVFMDKRAREPYLVWLLEAAVVNGEAKPCTSASSRSANGARCTNRSRLVSCWTCRRPTLRLLFLNRYARLRMITRRLRRPVITTPAPTSPK
jgi:hypothetical protein